MRASPILILDVREAEWIQRRDAECAEKTIAHTT